MVVLDGGPHGPLFFGPAERHDVIAHGEQNENQAWPLENKTRTHHGSWGHDFMVHGQWIMVTGAHIWWVILWRLNGK